MKKPPLIYIVFLVATWVGWAFYMSSHDLYGLFKTNWMAPLTMLMGSFIAGASSEGGGAVAFPVFTLLMDVPSPVARNFSFAIQSFGMTAASLLIIGLKIPVSWRAIIFTSIGGVVGLITGIYFVAPFIPNAETKIIFVSLWMSFGFSLYLVNRHQKREVNVDIHYLNRKGILKIVGFGFFGGIVTAIFGNGIDIFTFCLFTLYFKISEKVATPTSVIIMTIHTIIGFLWHLLIVKDFEPQARDFLLCSIPVVVIFAPLGAYVITFFTRRDIARLLYFIITVQYIGALLVIQPPLAMLLLSFLILTIGFLFFRYLSKYNYYDKGQ